MTRVLHFSDIHLEDGFGEVPKRAFLNKRLLGLLNLKLKRAPHFVGARAKVQALARFAEASGVDLAICTGDYTVLGTEPEMRLAREAVEPFVRLPLGLVSVPGNHDIYVALAKREAAYARCFGELERSELPEHALDEGYPFVRLFGARVAVVGLISVRPNDALHKSSGRIPDLQLEALARILADERLRDRFVFIATHYAPRLWNGRPDAPLHGLENAEALLREARVLPWGAIVHGHIHHRYHVREPGLRASLFCAGSATQRGREGAWLYDVGETSVRATEVGYEDGDYVLKAEGQVELPRAPA